MAPLGRVSTSEAVSHGRQIMNATDQAIVEPSQGAWTSTAYVKSINSCSVRSVCGGGVEYLRRRIAFALIAVKRKSRRQDKRAAEEVLPDVGIEDKAQRTSPTTHS